MLGWEKTLRIVDGHPTKARRQSAATLMSDVAGHLHTPTGSPWVARASSQTDGLQLAMLACHSDELQEVMAASRTYDFHSARVNGELSGEPPIRASPQQEPRHVVVTCHNGNSVAVKGSSVALDHLAKRSRLRAMGEADEGAGGTTRGGGETEGESPCCGGGLPAGAGRSRAGSRAAARAKSRADTLATGRSLCCSDCWAEQGSRSATPSPLRVCRTLACHS